MGTPVVTVAFYLDADGNVTQSLNVSGLPTPEGIAKLISEIETAMKAVGEIETVKESL